MKKISFCWCPTFVFMMQKFPWGIFSVWVLSVRDRDSFLSASFFDNNSILINMKKDAAHPYHISARPKKFLPKSTDPKLFFARICKKNWETFLKTLICLSHSNVLYLSTKKLEICAISVPFLCDRDGLTS